MSWGWIGTERGCRRGGGVGGGGHRRVPQPSPHPHLDVMPVHVAGGIAEEAVGDEAMRVDAVDEGEGGLGTER